MKKYTLIIVVMIMGIVGISAQEKDKRLPAIRQVWLDAKEVPSIIGAGSWSIVDREQFEKSWKQAEIVSRAERQPPWLVSSKYTVELQELQLKGTAELTFYNPHPIRAWTRLNPWLMPIQSESPLPFLRASDRSLSLLIDPNTRQTRQLKFSGQGEERRDGTWFNLQLPGSPQSLVDIIVPFSERLDCPSSRPQLTGPFPVGDKQYRRWQLTLGNQSRNDVQLLVRKSIQSAFSPWIEARCESDYVIGAESVIAKYEYEVQCWNDRLRSLEMDIPEQLKLKSVIIKHQATEQHAPWKAISSKSIQITLPESVEQRAVVILEGEYSHKGESRIKFLVPLLHHMTSLKHVLHIVTPLRTPLADWEWGDFRLSETVQRDRRNDASNELITLTQSNLPGSGPLQLPSARLISREVDLSYDQDCWLHLARHASKLTMQCQCTSLQGDTEFLSWTVPSTWSVAEVMSDQSTPLVWVKQSDKPLEVQLGKPLRPGQKVTLTVTLVPVANELIGNERSSLLLPHLVPLISGRFTGSYAITLERSGTLQPPSVSIIKAPGLLSSIPDEPPGLWSKAAVVPDFYWKIQQPKASGSVEVQVWPATVQVAMQVSLMDSDELPKVVYRIQVKPIAGQFKSCPVQFSHPMPKLNWHMIGSSKSRVIWSATDSQSGELVWPQGLDKPIEMEAWLPWKSGEPIAIMSSPQPFKGTFQHSQFLMLPDGKNPFGNSHQIDKQILWHYDANNTIASVELRPRLTQQLVLEQARMNTKIHGSWAESIYSATLPPRGEVVSLTLPEGVHFQRLLIDGKDAIWKQPLLIPVNQRPVHIELTYRTRTESRWWGALSSWKPVVPKWNLTASLPVDHQINFANEVISLSQQGTSLWGNASYHHEGIEAEFEWMTLQKLLFLSFAGFGLGWRVVLKRNVLWIIFTALSAVLFSFLGNPAFLPLSISICLGLVIPGFLQWVVRRIKPQMTVGTSVIVLVVFTVGSIGQSEQPTTLVYVIPGPSSKVIMPAALWSDIQQLSQATFAGPRERWWLTSNSTTGEMAGNRLRLLSRWNIEIEGNEQIEIPWPASQLPDSIKLDGEYIQPRLNNGPFGIQQCIVPISKSGSHNLEFGWEVAVKVRQGQQILELKLPGAPCQSLSVKGLPIIAHFQGGSGTYQFVKTGATTHLKAESGLTRSVLITWPLETAQPLEAQVNVGVLWEHRLQQSIAHAVVAYEIREGSVSELKIDLPTSLRIKNITLIGELQATVSPRIRHWELSKQETDHRLTVYLERPVRGTIHLLLEMPWLRTTEDLVPLTGVFPVGIPLRNGFVAYLADGVQVASQTKLTPAMPHEIEFARPWLPSLGSLPSSAVVTLPPPRHVVPLLQLKPIRNNTSINQKLSIEIGPTDSLHQFSVEVVGQQSLPVYLKAQVDPGLILSEVTGEHVLRWHQSSVTTTANSYLEIWLTTLPPATRETSLKITARDVLNLSTNQQIRLPVYQLNWKDQIQSASSIIVSNQRGSKVVMESVLGLSEVPSPKFEKEVLAELIMPVKSEGQLLLLREEGHEQRPTFTSTWQPKDHQWWFTLSAPVNGTLPIRFEVVIPNGLLEQDWQFESTSSHAVRPIRGQNNTLVWSLQFSKPVNKLVIKCSDHHVGKGHSEKPFLSFPQWPGLVIE